MELIITEKPSVARAIAEVVGATERQNGYLQGKGFLVSWCVGHLVELALPEVYDARYARWRYTDLPIIPEKWQYTVTDETQKQFDILKALINDPRVTGIICATDAGREGELIFRLVYQTAQCRKSVRRLWISSMEESAIREGFRAMKPMSAYDNLYQAALCRAQADWLIGMNATRLYSLLYGPTLHIGRVMSPTLAMLSQREKAIAEFRPETYYKVPRGVSGLRTADLPDGRPVDPKNLEKSFKEHQKRIGIPENERIDFQGLRKSGQMHKVRLSQNNYQLVAENAGQSPEVLMNHYNEALDYEKRALSRLVENSFYPHRETSGEAQDSADVSALMAQIQQNPELCRKLLQSLTLGTQQRA